MAVTVGELLAMPHLQLSLHAGARGTGREVGWAHTSDLPNPWEWLSSGDLLMANGIGLAAEEPAQVAFVEGLAGAGVSAFVMGLGTNGPPLTRALTERADELSLPVLSVPYSMSFTTITRAVAVANQREEAHQVTRVARLYEVLRTSVAGAVPGAEMFRRLGGELQARLYLVDPETGRSLFDDGEETAFAGALAEAFVEHGHAIPGVLRLRRTGPDGRAAVALAVAVPGEEATALVAEPLGDRLPGLALLQHVATVGALELAQIAAGRERLRREGADLLGRLLDRRGDADSAGRRLAETGLGPEECVLVQARASEEGTVDRLHCRLARLRVPHLLLRRDGTLNVVVADRPGHLDRLTALLDFAPSIGVSDRIRAADRLPEAAQQAYWALGAAEAENRRLVRYGDETALLLPRTPLEAQALVSRVLGPLLAHDAEHGTAYLRTLRVMLHRDRSWQLAADELHIHKQTLGYRLRRIEQLTGRGLTRTEHIAELWFAVRAHDMVQRRLPAAGAPAA